MNTKTKKGFHSKREERIKMSRKNFNNGSILKLAMIIGLLVVVVMGSSYETSAATRKCYTISSGNTSVYSDTGLTRKYGTIYGSDEITVIDVHDNYTKVQYPISGGRTKTGYISTSAILTATGGTTVTSKAQITTYKRPGGVHHTDMFRKMILCLF